MTERRIAFTVPGRTSSGGTAFAESFAEQVAAVQGRPVEVVATPAVGRIDVSAVPPGTTDLICLGARAVRVPGVRTVFWPLNVAPFERHVLHGRPASLRARLRHRALRDRLRRSVAAADALVFGSYHARTLYMGAYVEAAALPYTVIRGGTPSLDVDWPERVVAERPTSVLAVSHLYPYKGILEFVEAFGRVADRVSPEVHVRVAGADRDATYAAAVHRRVTELGLDDRVTVAPAAPAEMTELYRSADLAVFPSTCENAGSFALYDGLHAGLPTLCSDRSSMPEMVTGAVEFVNPYDADGFGRALLDVLGSARSRRALAARAAAWSDTAPTWRWRAERLVEFLEGSHGDDADPA